MHTLRRLCLMSSARASCRTTFRSSQSRRSTTSASSASWTGFQLSSRESLCQVRAVHGLVTGPRLQHSQIKRLIGSIKFDVSISVLSYTTCSCVLPATAAPTRAEVTRMRTYKTKEEVEKSKTVTTTVVVTLLVIAVVVPMLQYYG